jgi:hypothetical protein
MTDAGCIPNIGPRERRRRLLGGFAFLLVAAFVGATLVWFEAPRPWRLLVFLPAWAAALGFFQVSAKTCVALAARGLKNMDVGDEQITDPTELTVVRAQSRRIHIRAALTALVLAILLALVPF